MWCLPLYEIYQVEYTETGNMGYIHRAEDSFLMKIPLSLLSYMFSLYELTICAIVSDTMAQLAIICFSGWAAAIRSCNDTSMDLSGMQSHFTRCLILLFGLWSHSSLFWTLLDSRLKILQKRTY